ncbi:uncharacterized protein LOC134227182 isoform X2 [Armigeres subalbatus]|uniref:uncharacterized protein LOC134227182 isoform X2 n=1 Tax=Armigeres subalbatus TaxID=124917 RepID=UPI002ED64074
MGSFVRVASAGVSGQLESAGGNGVPTRHATTVDDNRATVKRLIKYLMVTRCKLISPYLMFSEQTCPHRIVITVATTTISAGGSLTESWLRETSRVGVMHSLPAT